VIRPSAEVERVASVLDLARLDQGSASIRASR
jgi:hypothetical protein